VLICDRDRKWSEDVRQVLDDAGVHVMRTPFQAPNANAVMSHSWIDGRRRMGNELIEGMVPDRHQGRICRRPRLGGLLNYYARAA
jgi:hypothetical protein